MLEKLIVIPARGGSKRLPGKNLLPLGGLPLICWTIRAALQQRGAKVVVSTDSQCIADVAVDEGVDVKSLRPDHLASDASTSEEVVKHVLGEEADDDGGLPTTCVLLQPTSPFRTATHLAEAIELFEKSPFRTLASVSALSHPSQWNTRIDVSGKMIFMQQDTMLERSQDYEAEFILNGAIYVFRCEDILRGCRIVDKESCLSYKMSKADSVDIDDEYDYALAASLAKSRLPALDGTSLDR